MRKTEVYKPQMDRPHQLQVQSHAGDSKIPSGPPIGKFHKLPARINICTKSAHQRIALTRIPFKGKHSEREGVLEHIAKMPGVAASGYFPRTNSISVAVQHVHLLCTSAPLVLQTLTIAEHVFA